MKLLENYNSRESTAGIKWVYELRFLSAFPCSFFSLNSTLPSFPFSTCVCVYVFYVVGGMLFLIINSKRKSFAIDTQRYSIHIKEIFKMIVKFSNSIESKDWKYPFFSVFSCSVLVLISTVKPNDIKC